MNSGFIIFSVVGLATGFLHYEQQKCPDKLSIADKWFDGNNWCICTDLGRSCTQEIVSMRKSAKVVCENVGEKWTDGCYKCRCRQKDIVCHVDIRCVRGLPKDPVDCVIHSGCVCGLDGVPSCIQDVLIKRKAINERWIVNHMGLSNTKEISRDKKEKNCELGTRWYDGANRCFCDANGKVTCGNPKHVAQRVDGFRFKFILCESGLVWDQNCKRCRCHVSGVAFCARIQNCTRNKSNLDTEILKNECEIGTEWDEGCKHCKCDHKANIVCDKSKCNPSFTEKEQMSAQTVIKPISSNFMNHVQIPPVPMDYLIRRIEDKPTMCGKYKPGERYWDKCNLCYCSESGALCTVMMCR